MILIYGCCTESSGGVGVAGSSSAAAKGSGSGGGAAVFERGRSYGTLPGRVIQAQDSIERENCSDTEAPLAVHEVRTHTHTRRIACRYALCILIGEEQISR